MNRILALALAAGTAAAVVGSNGSETAQAAATSTETTSASKTMYGWTAVAYHPHSPTDNRGTLRLISPTGAVRTVGELSDDAAVLDVSRDGRHVVTVRIVNGTSHFALWDTTTKKAAFLHLPGIWGAAYTKTGLLTWTYDNEQVQVRHLLYHRTFAGVATARYAVGDYTNISVPGDGSKFIETDRSASGGGSAVVRSTATGRTLSRTALPNYDCWGAQEWSPTTYQIGCQGEVDLGVSQPFELAYDGSMQPKALAPDGVTYMLRTSPRTALVNQTNGYRRLMKATPNGFSPLPGVTPDVYAAGAFGTTVFTFKQGRPGSFRLTRHDLTTGTTRTLAGGSRGGCVTSGVTIDGAH